MPTIAERLRSPSRRIPAVICLVAVAVAGRAGESPTLPEKDRVRVFLLAGQSNMAGRGKPLLAEDTTPHPRVFVLDRAEGIAPAVEPLHWDKGDRNGIGIGFAFARAAIERLPAQDAILLVPSAVGGTSLTAWHPSGRLYREAVRRTKLALARGTLAGVLWHQGEGGPEPSAYPAAFAAFVAALRDDLDAPEAPIVIGTVADAGSEQAPAINDMLRTIPGGVTRCFLADARGLAADGLHFTAESYRELGRRYAEAWCALAGLPAR